VLFPTIEFWIFFAAVFAGFWSLARRPRAWKLLLLAASYLFYAWWDVRFVMLLAAATAINFVGGHSVARTRGRLATLALAATIAADLALFGWFKYYDFVALNAAGAFVALGFAPPLPLVQITLPVGISFFTFMGISYVVDVQRGLIGPARLLDFAVYLSFFPHLVAGPIVRGAELLPQLARRAMSRDVDFSRAIALILGGLFKKVVLSTFLATSIVDPVFGLPSAHGSLESLVAVYAYAVQIWADFSGYTDIAIGVALLLGFRFPDNFDRPYAATSLRDFWRRWHMTLSRWLRDYLYIPLGGSRAGELPTARNLVITMVLGGLWHGAAWTFVAWGALHGAGQVIERALRARVSLPDGLPVRVAQRLLTFHVVCIGWVLFRADSLATARDVLVGLGRVGERADLVTVPVLAAIALGLALNLAPAGIGRWANALFARLVPPLQGAVVGTALAGMTALGPVGVPPFIYYRF
jgi:alginate O-acetyltransferase complex protein AlgI